MRVTKSQVVLRLPAQSFKRLQDWARQTGKTAESLTREIVEQALRQQTAPSPSAKTTRQILEAADRVRPLSPTLRHRIVPGVSLEEVRASIARVGGQPLSEIIMEQRGPKA